ncbi:MAG: EscU/YscU/HrcU family type III secretion system export apparatus switch protein, partial [Janthinobacterium lividum]
RIRELAAEHRVPVLEAPPLARALYHHVELNREIPGGLYGAVAEVLAWVFQLRRWNAAGGDRPEAPRDVAVPADLAVSLDTLNRSGAQDDVTDVTDVTASDVAAADASVRLNGPRAGADNGGNSGGNSGDAA